MTTYSARNTAMDLLARRDHSRRQLFEKLRMRSFRNEEIEDALDQLEAERLLDDARFCESYVHQRIQRGFGPLKIRRELVERGVASDLIEQQMAENVDRWAQLMEAQRQRKFGEDMPEDYSETAKQVRFLQNRGFSPEAVMRLFRR